MSRVLTALLALTLLAGSDVMSIPLDWMWRRRGPGPTKARIVEISPLCGGPPVAVWRNLDLHRRMAAGVLGMSLSAVVMETAKLLAAAAQRNAGLAVFHDLLADEMVDGADARAASVLPVCRFWSVALGQAGANVSSLCASLAALSQRLSWTQNPNYRRTPPSPDFLDNYGYAVLAGPADGPPALAQHDSLAFGVLLLGPRTHYPRHHHPASEVYIPLNAADWWCVEGPWREEVPGAVIHHAPNVPHATRAGQTPLLALYLWRGELTTHARLTENPTTRQG